MSEARRAIIQSVIRSAESKFQDWNSYWKKNLNHFATSDDKELVLLVLRCITEAYQEVSQIHQVFVDGFDRLARGRQLQLEVEGKNGTIDTGRSSPTSPESDISITFSSGQPELDDDQPRQRVNTLTPADTSWKGSVNSLASSVTSASDLRTTRELPAAPINRKLAFRNYMRAQSSSAASPINMGMFRSSSSSPAFSEQRQLADSSLPELHGSEIDLPAASTEIKGSGRRDSVSSVGQSSIASSLHANYFETVEDYAELDLKEEIVRGLALAGLAKPTVVQRKAIRPLIQGRNVIIEAPERSGKWAACAIAALQLLDQGSMECQIVICSGQITATLKLKELLKSVGQYIKPRILMCEANGGMADIKRLQTNRQIVLATPEALEKLCVKRALDLRSVNMFIIDDASILKHFQNELRDVFIRMSSDVQVVVFAPKIPVDMYSVLKKFVRNPVCIVIDEKEWARSTSGDFWHGYYDVRSDEWKLDSLKALFRSRTLPYVNGKSLVLCRRALDAIRIVSDLKKAGVLAFNMDNRTLRDLPGDFLSKPVSALVMTFSTLRTFSSEIRGLRMLVNYDLSPDFKDYIYGTQQLRNPGAVKGWVVNFVGTAEMLSIHAIQEYIGVKVEAIPSNAFSDLKTLRAQ